MANSLLVRAARGRNRTAVVYNRSKRSATGGETRESELLVTRLQYIIPN